ncbi:putative SET domain-containing protein [Lyophyllum shimeji]|uniref:SET domain-containing protein n=1 Tax=Lyophyllum shimeji TaxID=47721 RepID=A0A9P3UTW6_LYOSH|nr:putative SET domain-containing protein [Lyophyllum shimeji]
MDSTHGVLDPVLTISFGDWLALSASSSYCEEHALTPANDCDVKSVMGTHHRDRKETSRPHDDVRNDDKKDPADVRPKKSEEKKDLLDVLPSEKPKPDLDAVRIPHLRSISPDRPLKAKFPKDCTFEEVELPLEGDGPKTLCLLFPGAREGILTLRGFPAPLPRAAKSLSREPLYDIRRIPGLGRGAVANKALQPGDLIICERPLLLFPAAFPKHGPESRGTRFKDMVESLPREKRDLVFDLHNCMKNGLKNVKGIIDTNSLGIGRLPGSYKGAYAVLCPRIARMNHSCSPNAERCWDLKSMAFYVRALRPIAKGEQICITYCPLLQSRVARQANLSQWDFNCACRTCSMPKAESSKSDVRRWILDTSLQNLTDKPDFRDHEHTLKKWAADPSLPDDHVHKHSQLQLQLMDEEGVYIEELWFAHCEIICKALCALQDRKGVVKLAKKAAIMSTVYRGTRGGWQNVAAAPEKTPWWGLRKKTAELKALD